MSKYIILTLFLLVATQLYVACNDEEERVEVGQNGLVEVHKGFSNNYREYQRASKLLQENKVQEAITVYKHLCIIEDDKLKIYAYMGLATAYISAEEYQNAISFYDKSITADSTNVESYVGLGSAYLSLKDYPKAISFYETARNKNQNNSDSYWGLALTYNEMQQTDSAKANAKEFIRLEPNSNYKTLADSIIGR